MPTWYAFQNAAAEADATTVSIFDEIGFWGITAKDFISELGTVKAKTLNLEINSPGGSVFDGIAIYNALRNSGKTVNVKVMGVAASIASIIAMAGDKISMPENTFMMVHQPWGVSIGNADDMRDYADVLDKLNNSLVATYVKRTGKTEDEIRSMLSKDTWLSAQEAVDAGFADEVVPAFQVTAKFDPERLPEQVKAIFAQANSQKPAVEEPTAEPAQVEETFAEQVAEMAQASGFEKYAANWAVAFSKVEDVQAAITEAREIKSLCALLKRDADEFIAARKTLADVRADLTNALADADESTHVDTSTRTSNGQSSGAQPRAVNTAAIWDAYRKQQGA